MKWLCGSLAALLLVKVASSTMLIADGTMTRMIELTSGEPYCIIHSDRGVIQRMVLQMDPSKVKLVSQGTVNALETACTEKTLTIPQQGGFIYPGTKWCGPGNRASNYKDLGVHTAEDKCCREHDHCANALQPGECKRSVCNTGRYTRSHCDCDARFRRCLQTINTETSNTIGAIYFNVIQVICFKERRPCSQWQSPRYKQCDPTTLLIKMPRYRDYRNPIALRNLLLLGNTDIARFNQDLLAALIRINPFRNKIIR